MVEISFFVVNLAKIMKFLVNISDSDEFSTLKILCMIDNFGV